MCVRVAIHRSGCMFGCGVAGALRNKLHRHEFRAHLRWVVFNFLKHLDNGVAASGFTICVN